MGLYIGKSLLYLQSIVFLMISEGIDDIVDLCIDTMQFVASPSPGGALAVVIDGASIVLPDDPLNHYDDFGDTVTNVKRSSQTIDTVGDTIKGGLDSGKLFKNQELLGEHYGKHGGEIADVLGKSN